MHIKKKLTCTSWSVSTTPSNKAERVSIGRFQRSSSYCWVQETSRMKENEIWNKHMHLKKKLTCRSWSVKATPSNKAERVGIGRFRCSKSYCWVQETSRMKENEIWNKHMHLKKKLTCRSWSVKATPSNKAERVGIGRFRCSKSYCWVQETSRMKENEIWNKHMHLKKKLTCRSWSVKATPSNKAERVGIGRFRCSKSYCWVQETTRMKENEIWNKHMHIKKKLTWISWSVSATPSNIIRRVPCTCFVLVNQHSNS